MRIVELINKVQLPISNEEADVLGKFENDKELHKADLTEREISLANQLVNKDVLLRKNRDGRIIYKKKIPE